MLNKPSMQHIEVDGQPMLIASMLRKGTAVAIDLGLIVAFAFHVLRCHFMVHTAR